VLYDRVIFEVGVLDVTVGEQGGSTFWLPPDHVTDELRERGHKPIQVGTPFSLAFGQQSERGVPARPEDTRRPAPYVFLGADGATRVMPGGVTRVALEEGADRQRVAEPGGAKDTAPRTPGSCSTARRDGDTSVAAMRWRGRRRAAEATTHDHVACHVVDQRLRRWLPSVRTRWYGSAAREVIACARGDRSARFSRRET
jgi:hypothetical protein